jgi:hypothetical protein
VQIRYPRRERRWILREGRKLRAGILLSIAAVVSLLIGPGVAIAADGSASLDDPIDTITDTIDTVSDTVDDPLDSVTDTVEEPIDTITDTVDDPVGTVSDAVDATGGTISGAVDATSGTIGGALEDSLGPVAGGVGNATSGSSDSSGGTDDPGADPPAGPETASASVTPTAQRGPEGSSGASAFAGGPDDLDDLTESGNDVVEGSAGPVCVGPADIVCLDLVGGLGAFGLLFRATEEARDVVSAFVDGLANTGTDLVGEMVLLIALTLTGIGLTVRRRRSGAQPAGS